jgi:N-acetyltransferase 10
MGYGARALQALNAYYSGEYFSLEEVARPEEVYPDSAVVPEVCNFVPIKTHRLRFL